MRILTLILLILKIFLTTQMFMALRRSLNPARDKAIINTSSNWQIIPFRKELGNLRKTSWINVFWMISITSLSKLLLILLLFITPNLVVKAQQSSNAFDYDLNGRRVTFYPESLMISYNPHVIIYFTRALNSSICLLIYTHRILVTILPSMILVMKMNLIS